MSSADNSISFRRAGLFGKYVASLVGLVVFVLAVNGALESWISYHTTRASLTDTMNEKALSLARRVAQSVTELERQISWVTRASVTTTAQRRTDFVQLLSQQPDVTEIFQLDGAGREQLRLSRTKAVFAANTDYGNNPEFTKAALGGSATVTTIRNGSPVLSIAVAHSAREAGVTVADIDPAFLSRLISDSLPGRVTITRIIDGRGIVISSPDQPASIGQDISKLPQIAALLAPTPRDLSSGTDSNGTAVLTAAHPIKGLGWFVVQEQPASQALAPIRRVLIRIGLLIALGTLVAIIAAMVLARRMLVPIRALRAGASKIGDGDFTHRIEVKTADELEALAGQFNSMAGQLNETYTDLENKVEARTRDLAHTISELAAAHDVVQHQAEKLREQKDELVDWNKSLEARVEKQLGEIERIRRLERFLPPQVAQLIASSDGHDSLLASHRREITVVFCDLRGFTAFTETTEPEEAMNVLREYHAALGRLIFRYEGTLDRYAGDGVMILFNAPIQFADHTSRAVRMAVEMQAAIGALCVKWRNRGHSLGFGIGIAVGYATLGQIGFEHRLEYAAIGSVSNLASRLCDEAQPGQIIASQRAFGIVAEWAEGQSLDALQLKGFNAPVLAVEITGWRDNGAVPASGGSA